MSGQARVGRLKCDHQTLTCTGDSVLPEHRLLAHRVDEHETTVDELDHVSLESIEAGQFEDDLLEETVPTVQVLWHLFDLA